MRMMSDLRARIAKIIGRGVALGALALLAVTLPAEVSAAGAEAINGNEWHRWRGPSDLGTSPQTGLVDEWTGEEQVLWKSDTGGGRSTPIVFNDKVYVIRLSGEGPTWQEEVVAFDAHTGEVEWRHQFDLFHTDIPSDRVGWSALAGDPETGNIYAHGVQGIFNCYDGETGDVKWSRSLTEEFGRISGYGGRTHTPIVDQDKVIISALFSGLGPFGRGSHRYLAMDKETGEVIYWSEPGPNPDDTTFSVPTVAVIDGVRQMIAANANGNVYGIEINTGEPIWEFHLSKRGLNSSVVEKDGIIYAMHSEDNLDEASMGRVVAIDASGKGDVTGTHELWRVNELRVGYASPALHDGILYVIDNSANLFALDAKTGEQKWMTNVGKVGWGSPVVADGKIYVAEVDGVFHILDAKTGEVLSEYHVPVPEGRAVEDIRGCPAVAYGNVYLQSRSALYALKSDDYEEQEHWIDPLADTGEAEGPAATALVVPAEIHIAPGDEVEFTTLLFDAKGRAMGEADDASYKVQGLKGEMDGNAFTADEESGGQFGMVMADAEGTTNTARVRVMPPMPFSEDFEDLEVGSPGPSWWIGATRVKYSVEEEEGGNKVWKKDAENIQFRRSYVFMGPPEMKDYTVQADVKAEELRRNLPDFGIVNSRYVMDVRGNHGEARIFAWVPHPRVISTVPFEAEPGVWYRMKCRVDYEDDSATVRGKIWNRDEAEPEEWTITLEDPQPNRNGSPGVACFSLGPVYYDNISVTPSE